MGRTRRGRRAALVGALGPRRARAAARRAHGRAPAAARPRSATGARPSRATPPRPGCAELERLGRARRRGRRCPARRRDMWPLFLHEARRRATATRSPSRADEYGAGDAAEARGGAARRADAVARGVRGAHDVARVRARGRPLRQPVHRDRAAGRGRGRARGAAAAVVVPALGQPDRLGRARDREHAVRRAATTRPCSPPGWPGSVGKLPARARGRWIRRIVVIAGLRRAARGRLRQGRAEALGARRAASRSCATGARRHRGARPAGRRRASS